MAMSSSSGFEQWGYAIGRLHRARHGKMDIRRGSSVQSDGIALTMSLCSANDISAICSIPTKNITTKLGRTYRCTRTRQSHVLSRPSVARWRCQFWAGCITNISGRKFPTGTAAYLTAGEIFPLEIRALAIAFFFAIGTGIGGVVSPWLFANLINEGRESLYLGFIVLSATMTAAALIELIWGVAAERRPLEDVARPLTFIK